MKKILMCGSRSFQHADLIRKEIDAIEQPFEILHGGAYGADEIVEEYAQRRGIKTTILRPLRTEYSQYYLHRNAELVALCDEVIAFWDGSSRGTGFVMRYAEGRGKPVKVVKAKKFAGRMK